jgi:hypothetical protein
LYPPELLDLIQAGQPVHRFEELRRRVCAELPRREVLASFSSLSIDQAGIGTFSYSLIEIHTPDGEATTSTVVYGPGSFLLGYECREFTTVDGKSRCARLSQMGGIGFTFIR